ncbi:MAG: DUF5693 family protein, partial [bacterium]|nr:DUF5693 family protein [bacterium]
MQARNNSRLLLLLRIGAGLFLVLLIFLILATRIHLESGLNQVMLAVDYSDLRDISLYRGYLLDQLLDDLKSSGFTTLLIHEDTLASALVDGRIHQLPATSDFPTRLTTPDKQLASQLKQVFTLRFPATRCRQTTVADGTLTELSLAMDLTIQRTPSATVKSWPKIKHLGIGYPRTAIRLLQQKGFFLIPHYVVRSGENTGIIEHILDTAEWDQVELPLLISGTVLPSSDCIKNLVRARGVRPVEVEFGATIGWDSLKRSLKPGRFLKAHIISREIVANNHDRRIMFRLARAARERRVTILCPALRFRTHTDTDLWETNLDFLKNTRSMLREQNLHVSNELPSISMFLPLLFPVVFIPVVAMLLAAAPRPLALCGFLVVLVFSAFLLNGDVQPNQVIALWAALFFPVAAVVRFWPTEAQDHNPHTRPEILVRAVRAFLGATGFTLFGALVTASLLTTPDMLFGATLFRGVKLAYLLPPFLTAAVLFFRMDHPLRRVYRLFTERLTLIHLLIVLLVVTGTILYLTRSGNVPLLKPSNLERDIRDWLENIMVARPRT